MFRSYLLGRAFGIPMYVHTTFFLLPLFTAFMSAGMGLTGILLGQAVLLSLFACVLLHELGHALMARAYGIPTRDITLYPIGGVARLESTGHRPAEEVAIALAGPAVNLLLVLLLSPFVVGLAFFGVPLSGDALLHGPGRPVSLLGNYLTMLWIGNLLLLGFNLIPAFPMDGGRVFRALLSIPLGLLRATSIAANLGTLIAILLGVAGVFQGIPTLVLVALFVAGAGQAEYRALRRRMIVPPAPVGPLEEPELVIVRPMPLPIPTIQAAFTGLVWDREHQVWVQWVDGKPVAIR